MSRSYVRLLGVLAVVGVLLLGAGYTMLGRDRTAAACGRIRQEVQNLLALDVQTLDPDQLAQRFATSAATIRDQGRNAGGDVGRIAEKLAIVLDKNAATYRSRSSGNVQTPDYFSVTGTAAEFQEVCKSGLPGHGG